MKRNDEAIILSNLPWEGDVSITGTNHPPEHTATDATLIFFLLSALLQSPTEMPNEKVANKELDKDFLPIT